MYGGRSKHKKSKTQKKNARKLKEWTRMLRRKTKPMYGKTYAEKMQARQNILNHLKDKGKEPTFTKGSKINNDFLRARALYMANNKVKTGRDGVPKKTVSNLRKLNKNWGKTKHGKASNELVAMRQLGMKMNKNGEMVATRKRAKYRQNHAIPINNRTGPVHQAANVGAILAHL